MLTARGVTAVKCATTLELITACESGATDILLAYPAIGPTADRTAAIALTYPQIAISVLVDSKTQLRQWAGTRVGVFLDIDPGMDRTGVPQDDLDQILGLAKSIREDGITFRGLHYYDGHLNDENIEARTRQAHAGYDQLLRVAELLETVGIPINEVITAGTPAFPCALSYLDFVGRQFVHRVSPGTLVYGDQSSLAALPQTFGYRFAALVLSRVISVGAPGRFSCDAGHKALSVDAGVPNCSILGWESLTPSRPSEEHLPVSVLPGDASPKLGEVLYLAPKHVCPTVNNFSHALIVRDGKITCVQTVSARGREFPILPLW
jgi:D-serine deaminase-like pyridoxal phosphate-dependent protein